MVKKSSGQKNYAVLLTCWILALFALFAVKLSINYTASYRLRIVLTNLPEDKLLTSLSDTVMVVTFEDKGLSLLPLEMSSKKIVIDYQEMASSYQKKYNNICFQKQQIIQYIQQQHKFSDNVKQIKPERICLHLQNR